MFRSIPIYVKLYENRVEIIRLDNQATISRVAADPFSNSRMIIWDFFKFEIFLRSCIDRVVQKKFLTPPLDFLMHVVQEYEGGLGNVEKRAIIDSGEHAGGKKVKIYEGKNELSISEALEELRRK